MKSNISAQFFWVSWALRAGRISRSDLLRTALDSVHVHVTQKHVKWFTPARAQLKERRSRAYGHAIVRDPAHLMRRCTAHAVG